MGAFLEVWWSALFAAGTVLMMCIFPGDQDWGLPKYDLSGRQAITVVTSPWFLGCWVPLLVCLYLLPSFAKKHKLAPQEQGMMVWFLTNVFWFHTGCDVLSGYFQVMPALTELYKAMNPAHTQQKWAPDRAFLDAGYMLELLCEVPLGLWVLYLYARRHPGRNFVEVFAVAVQAAGTVMYYAPPLMRGEPTASWVSYCDRGFGSVWIIFPLLVLLRHLRGATAKTVAVDVATKVSPPKEVSAPEMPSKPNSDKGGARKRVSSPSAKSAK